MPHYAELQATSNFTFLTGGSHPGELAAQAAALGLSAIAITDRNTLAGVVRAHVAAKEAGIRFLVGCRLDLEDGLSLLAYPKDRDAYGRLCRLLTLGQRRAEKGKCILRLADVAAHAQDIVFAIVSPDHPLADGFPERLAEAAKAMPRPYLTTSCLYRGDDRRRLAQLAHLARAHGLKLLATGDVLYHHPDRRPLQDVLTCIREKCTLRDAGFRLQANAERHLKPAEEMARLFKGYEEALESSLEIVRACTFSLDKLQYEYPDEPVPPGKTAQTYLEELAWKGADWRYPNGVPEKIRATIAHELELIRGLKYAPYFLTVYDIVRYARSQEILCQGRGSAANSVVCYCLGITAVDPTEVDLLFERFVSAERGEPPDIDVDFEHERREEVIQYIYARYGRARAGLAATVISYRARSAVREVGKAMGLTEDVVAALAGTVWGSHGSKVEGTRAQEAGFDLADPTIAMTLKLTEELVGFPRHLSQHVGGFVLTRGLLSETVPIGNAAMEDRTVVEWDKDDLDAVGLLKIDVLGLGMLTCLRKSFELLEAHHGRKLTLATIPREDPAVYDMLCKADSLGVFQVESRAQMSMLPRLKPRNYYDLVIEVAIVRPGPIQGDMVHPYLRRRDDKEDVVYPAPAPEHGPPDELEKVLRKTLGVPLFQEQAMKIAIEAAKFTPDEANQLRRAMATFRRRGEIDRLKDKFVGRMIERGYDPELAMRCFKQIEGFGDYGFPESHAASFAHLVYASSWVKHYYPDVFCAALLNAQPMGFYAPAQIVRDAKSHGVEVREADVNLSDWDNGLESLSFAPPSPGLARGSITTALRDSTQAPVVMGPPPSRRETDKKDKKQLCAVRLGFRQVDGLDEKEAKKVVKERTRPYTDAHDLWRRAGASLGAIEKLAEADAFRSMGQDRRQALWAVRGLKGASPLPLFAAAEARELGAEPEAKLPVMALSEHVIADYQTLRLSLKAHPMSFLREHYQERGALTTEALWDVPENRRVSVAGLVLVRQRPGTAKGVIFMTIEDETGIANIIVWPDAMERYRKVVMGASLIEVRGRLQREDLVMHIIAERMTDETARLTHLSRSPDDFKPPFAHADMPSHAMDTDPTGRGGGHKHPRNVRVIPKSRDFH